MLYIQTAISLLKISDNNKVQPFNAHEDTGVPFHLNLDSILRRDHKKKLSYEYRAYESVEEKSIA